MSHSAAGHGTWKRLGDGSLPTEEQDEGAWSHRPSVRL